MRGRGTLRGRFIRGRGGPRGGRGRGRGGQGRGRGTQEVSREDLDNQLDAYMSKTKSYLDSELDEYMSHSAANDSWTCAVGVERDASSVRLLWRNLKKCEVWIVTGVQLAKLG